MKAISLFALLLTLLWEHDGLFTSSFVVERTTDLVNWQIIGFVSVENKWATNATDFTYRWHSDSEPFGVAFYRVGAVPENQDQ